MSGERGISKHAVTCLGRRNAHFIFIACYIIVKIRDVSRELQGIRYRTGVPELNASVVPRLSAHAVDTVLFVAVGISLGR